MKKIVLFTLLFCSQLIVAQEFGIYKEKDADTKPSFPGGLKSYTNFVNKNFNWKIGKYTKSVTMEFTVQTNGVIIVSNVMGLLDPNILKEALRVIGLSPKWKPATVKGKKVVCTIIRSMYNPNPEPKNKIVKAAVITKQDALEPVTVIEPVAIIKDENQIYNTAGIEEQPEYSGGIKQFYTFFNTNFKTPEQENLKGKILVSFIIEKDGSMSNIKLLRDIGYGTGEETIRVLKMMRKWIPGRQNGKPVRVSYTLPIQIDNTTAPSPENK